MNSIQKPPNILYQLLPAVYEYTSTLLQITIIQIVAILKGKYSWYFNIFLLVMLKNFLLILTSCLFLRVCGFPTNSLQSSVEVLFTNLQTMVVILCIFATYEGSSRNLWRLCIIKKLFMDLKMFLHENNLLHTCSISKQDQV